MIKSSSSRSDQQQDHSKAVVHWHGKILAISTRWSWLAALAIAHHLPAIYSPPFAPFALYYGNLHYYTIRTICTSVIFVLLNQCQSVSRLAQCASARQWFIGMARFWLSAPALAISTRSALERITRLPDHLGEKHLPLFITCQLLSTICTICTTMGICTITPFAQFVPVWYLYSRTNALFATLCPELQKRANRANLLVLIFPGRCKFYCKARKKLSHYVHCLYLLYHSTLGYQHCIKTLLLAMCF